MDNPEEGFDFHEIDLNQLEVEWQEQVRMYRHYAEKLADARLARDQAKTDRDVAKENIKTEAAAVDLDVRRDPAKYGLEKLTEKAVENHVLLSSEYQDAQAEFFRLQRTLNEAEHNVGVYEAAIETLDNRKKALEDQVFLWGRDYFSAPKLRDRGEPARRPMGGDRKRPERRSENG